MDPLDLELTVWLAIAAVFLLAGLAHGILGLGFPMLATPLIAILFDVRSAILLTLLPTIGVNLVSILRGGRWSESIGRYWPLALMIPLGALMGTWLLISVDPDPFRLLLAGIILLHLFNDRLRAIRMDWIRTRTWLAYLLFGLAAGISAGTVNVMVPLLIIFALEVGMSKLAMVQVFNLCFLAGKVAQVGAFSFAGVLSLEAPRRDPAVRRGRLGRAAGRHADKGPGRSGNLPALASPGAVGDGPDSGRSVSRRLERIGRV